VAHKAVEQLEQGGLWRDVVNFLGDGPVEPSIYLPMLRQVLPRWRDWTYFLGQAAGLLERDRAEVERDAAKARLGWDVWINRREGLHKFASRAAGYVVDDNQLEAWWIRDERVDWASKVRAIESSHKFARAVRITAAEDEIVEPESRAQRRKGYKHDWLIIWINRDLVWIDELEALRTLARKTWSDASHRPQWSQTDLEFLNGYYEEQLPSLYVPGEPEVIDPFELDTLTWDQNLGMGLDGLHYCFYVLMRATIADFADEILERNRHPTRRGSLRCIECGLFVGRRALGHGQLYCSDRCKKRAAKRRYRGRARVSANGSVK
jgi:hypothetical protein